MDKEAKLQDVQAELVQLQTDYQRLHLAFEELIRHATPEQAEQAKALLHGQDSTTQ